MVLVSAWAGLSMCRGAGSQFGCLLVHSQSSWSPITASWWAKARAVLSLILNQENAEIWFSYWWICHTAGAKCYRKKANYFLIFIKQIKKNKDRWLSKQKPFLVFVFGTTDLAWAAARSSACLNSVLWTVTPVWGRAPRCTWGYRHTGCQRPPRQVQPGERRHDSAVLFVPPSLFSEERAIIMQTTHIRIRERKAPRTLLAERDG